MMPRVKLLGQVAAALAFLANAGCIVVSLEPLYTDQDVVFDAALLGEWGEADGKDPSDARITFAKLGEHGYAITWGEHGDTTRLVGHLVKLGDLLFLDVCPQDLKAQGVPEQVAGGISDWFVPIHMVARIHQTAPSLMLSLMADRWTKEYLDAHPGSLGHTARGDDVLFTAPPDELRRFLLEHARDKGAFEEPAAFVRPKR